MWGAEAYLAQSQRIPGVSSWVLQWWILHREKARPSSGLLSSSRSEFLARGLCPRQSSPPTTVVSCYSFSATHHKKKSLQGILRPDKGPDRNGGWVQELSESRRVWPRPTSRQSKPPVFPRASIRALEPRGPCRKYGKWRARPLDQTGNAFFLSSGGSEMSPSWRLDTSGHRGSPHPAGVRWLDRTTKKVISALDSSSTPSLPPPLPFPELLGLLPFVRTSDYSLMFNLAPNGTAPCPIFHCPPSARTPGIWTGPQPLRERSFPPWPNSPAAPVPHLGRAGLLRDRRDTRSQTGSAQLTAPGRDLYMAVSTPLLLVLRNFWKVGNASGERCGSQSGKKKAKDLPQNRPGSRPCACGRSPSPWVLLPPRPAGLGALLLKAWTSLDS
ncbi:uncharacterized protein LOC121144466 [Mesocricetus auratus]|uniref:Uncharacterized protein LOC121144466 n=1 Tax=Mesocricetus auratus TaxID=10036 RepID=A0ABM2YHF1_MESAU|nr:uncharacterized protein LOC121144466 [Mesocricetus auratus]